MRDCRWIPEFVLHTTVGMFSLTWAGIAFFSTYAAYNSTSEYAVGLAFAVAVVGVACSDAQFCTM